ncbi:MAG: sigma-70 family RNA polymerase sigma factor [Gemmatimonadales bacterium]|jgi:RNA polymerase sigma-70 factor (ECF subfamily)|nr:sigma-70 family RNA polymerase sigma factor [Gemmatimonadales bacterium]
MAESTGGAPAASFDDVALPLLDDVARFARWLAGDAMTADDLVQETFLRALRGWGTFRAGSDYRAWLFTICRNVHYSARRRAVREPLAGEPEVEALATASLHREALAHGLGSGFDRFDLHDAVRREVQALPDGFREVTVLVDLEDLSYEAAAAALGIPVGTVRSRLFRARRLLQERLVQHARDAGLGRQTTEVPR